VNSYFFKKGIIMTEENTTQEIPEVTLATPEEVVVEDVAVEEEVAAEATEEVVAEATDDVAETTEETTAEVTEEVVAEEAAVEATEEVVEEAAA
jgi:hypothetical protein